MTYWPTTSIKSSDSPSVDGFGRWRTSTPYTLFDSKQIDNASPLLWDDSGSASTSTTHSINQASVRLRVSNTTPGTRIRQTFSRFVYQPGKGQEVIMSFSEFDTVPGLTKRLGYFNTNNGIFLENSGSETYFVIRDDVSGTVVNTKVSQSDWNLDKMDGTGNSEVDINWANSQILFIDFEWLGVGRVRTGFFSGGQVVYAHEFLNANVSPMVYMATPVLPLRFEISNDGTGPADDLVQICSSIMSEGGREETGIVRHRHHLNAGVYNGAQFTHAAMIGIRLKAGRRGTANLLTVSFAATTNDQAHWMVALNPTVAGSFTWNDQPNSIVQIATGSIANTITGGTHLEGGFFSQNTPRETTLQNPITFGMGIDGTPQRIVLTLVQLTGNITPYVSLEWREDR